MKYRVKIELLETVDGDKPNYVSKDIYEQVVENLNVKAVIATANQLPEYPGIPNPYIEGQ